MCNDQKHFNTAVSDFICFWRYLALITTVHEQEQSNGTCNILQFCCFGLSLGFYFFYIFTIDYHTFLVEIQNGCLWFIYIHCSDNVWGCGTVITTVSQCFNDTKCWYTVHISEFLFKCQYRMVNKVQFQCLTKSPLYLNKPRNIAGYNGTTPLTLTGSVSVSVYRKRKNEHGGVRIKNCQIIIRNADPHCHVCKINIYCVVLCCVVLCFIVLYRIVSYRIVSYRNRIVSYHIIFYFILFYFILNIFYYILLYFILLYFILFY